MDPILGLKLFSLPEDVSRNSCRRFVCAQQRKRANRTFSAI